MSDTANTIRKKVERAEEHFENLKATFGLSGSPIESPTPDTVHVDAQGNLVYRTDLIEPTPEHGIMIGDVVHQLRSCLDHITYAMAEPVCTNNKLLRKTQFPIFDKSSKLENSPRFVDLKRIFGDSSPQIAQIRLSQPYQRHPARPTADYLWIVSELDNIDKHRTILVMNPAVTIAGTTKSGSESRGFHFRKYPIKAGAAVMNLDWPSPDPPPEVDVERVTPFIVFSETDGLCDDMSIFPLTRKMIEAVSGVIDAFESKGLI